MQTKKKYLEGQEEENNKIVDLNNWREWIQMCDQMTQRTKLYTYPLLK